MTYAFIQDVPATEAMYGEIRDALGEETPEGLISHVVLKQAGGLRYVDVWETQADWERFRAERLDPVLGAVLGRHGLQVDRSQVRIEDVEAVDAWVGTAQPMAADR